MQHAKAAALCGVAAAQKCTPQFVCVHATILCFHPCPHILKVCLSITHDALNTQLQECAFPGPSTRYTALQRTTHMPSISMGRPRLNTCPAAQHLPLGPGPVHSCAGASNHHTAHLNGIHCAQAAAAEAGAACRLGPGTHRRAGRGACCTAQIFTFECHQTSQHPLAPLQKHGHLPQPTHNMSTTRSSILDLLLATTIYTY